MTEYVKKPNPGNYVTCDECRGYGILNDETAAFGDYHKWKVGGRRSSNDTCGRCGGGGYYLDMKIKIPPDLRKQFFSTMCEIAEEDKSVRLLVGDLGFSFMEPFAEKYPDQFINCGIAEQNMVGVAAGMALGGLKPYCYSGAIFLLMRAYEQIRDDVCYNNLNVKLIGTGASPFLGFSHNFCGDENENDLLKNLPNIKTYYPKTEFECREMLFNIHKDSAPAFLRI